MLRNFFSSVLFILFCFFSVPLLFLFSISQTYFSADFYRGSFVDHFHDSLKTFITDQTAEVGKTLNISFTEEEIEPIVAESLERNFVEENVNQFVTQFQNLSPANPSVHLDFSTFKEPLKNFFSRIVDLFLKKTPTCTTDTAPQTKEGIPSCIPAEWRSPEFQQKFRTELDQSLEERFLQNFSSQGSLFSQSFEISFAENIEQIETIRKISSMLLFFSIVFLLLLFVFVFLIQWKPWTRNFVFLGKMFFISSILLFLFSFLFSYGPNYLKPEYFPSEIHSSFDAFQTFFRFFVAPLGREFFEYGAVFFLFSIAFYYSGRRYIHDTLSS